MTWEGTQRKEQRRLRNGSASEVNCSFSHLLATFVHGSDLSVSGCDHLYTQHLGRLVSIHHSCIVDVFATTDCPYFFLTCKHNLFTVLLHDCYYTTKAQQHNKL
jgi:hypothetical protein